MRMLALAILTTITALTSAPAQANRYGGGAPVRLHKYYWNGGDSYNCTFLTMAQFNGTASGLAATCGANPYYPDANANANAHAPAVPDYRRPRRAY
jgi:hypothetical protein